MHKTMIVLAAVLLSSKLQAASVFKCVDAAGKVTFTQNQNCPRTAEFDAVVNARNATPSGSSSAVRMGDPARRTTKSGGQSFTVVGERPTPAAVQAVPAAEQQTPRAAGRNAAQPCIKMVERLVRCQSATGGGCAEIIKVPVAC